MDTKTDTAPRYPRSVVVDGLTITRSQFLRASDGYFGDAFGTLLTIAANRRAGVGYHAEPDGYRSSNDSTWYRAGEPSGGGVELFGGLFEVDHPDDDAVEIAEGWLLGEGAPTPPKPRA